MGILKISELINFCKKFWKFVKLPTYKNFFLDVIRKVIYFILERLKGGKRELKHQVDVSLAKYVVMVYHDCSYNRRFFFTNTEPRIVRIPNQNIPNTPLNFLNFSFSIKGHSNLNCLQWRVGRKLVNSSIVD